VYDDESGRVCLMIDRRRLTVIMVDYGSLCTDFDCVGQELDAQALEADMDKKRSHEYRKNCERL
jgi:hypothetical protein